MRVEPVISRAACAVTIQAVTALLVCLLAASPALAQQPPGTADTASHLSTHTAPVIVDGNKLFELRGVSAFPAERRAEETRRRIIEAARNESIRIEDFRVEDSTDHSSIYAGDTRLIRIVDEDAEVENLHRSLLATIYLQAITETVVNYRAERAGATLLRNAGFALAATLLVALLLWGLRWVFNKLDAWTERHVKRRVQKIAYKSHQLIHAGTVWSLIRALLKLLRFVVYLLIAYFYLNTVLGLFPWTRPAARVLLDLVLDPLLTIWNGFLEELPSLVFLVVLWFVVRYLLKVVRAFFTGVGSGRIRLQNFDADWADPTYKIVRILVIALALVLAYPYIPGSESAAFKGVSVFVGVLLSLGSSSFISNIIAGLTMTYRGAFREGDLVKVGDTVGWVQDVKLMVTRLRTYKNESVILPNSNVLNTEVVNYSQMAANEGLVLHSTVGIGYDTPWRQVEAMLLEAAARTAGLKADPPPFVLQAKLGDFAVDYQVNAYWDGSGVPPRIYSALHGHIQDVFNENGVQIMSPAYEADPAAPKIVPPDQWYAAPAKKPAPAENAGEPGPAA